MHFNSKTLAATAVLSVFLTTGLATSAFSMDEKGQTHHANRSGSDKDAVPDAEYSPNSPYGGAMERNRAMRDKEGTSTTTTSSTSMNNQGSSMEMLRTKSGKDFDQTFISELINHHQEEISMATLAKQKARDKQVKQMAEDVIAENNRQIDELRGLQSGNKMDKSDRVSSSDDMMMHE
jgi:uncharacterized protein (DUF305 family)